MLEVDVYKNTKAEATSEGDPFDHWGLLYTHERLSGERIEFLLASFVHFIPFADAERTGWTKTDERKMIPAIILAQAKVLCERELCARTLRGALLEEFGKLRA